MNNMIRIGDTVIHIDESGRYCLNDLHRAAGGANKNRPSLWLKNKRTKSLIFELEVAGISATHTIENVGTFVQKELVYAFGMWISPQFYLHVIRAYDALVMSEHNKLESAQKRLRRSIVRDENCLSAVFKQKDNKATHAMFKAMEILGLIRMTIENKPVYKKEITETGWEYCLGYSKDGVVRIKPEKHSELISLLKGVTVGQIGGVSC